MRRCVCVVFGREKGVWFLSVFLFFLFFLKGGPRGKPDCPERPTVGESQSNGIIERAVRFVAGQARTLKAALEHRIGTRIPPDARILCWLVEFAAYLTNKCDIGSDGETPLFRLHGRKDNTPIPEFGEKILYMPAKPPRGGKWEPRLLAEAVVVTEQWLLIKTIHESEGWDTDRILGMRAVSWSPDGTHNAFGIQVGMERPQRWCLAPVEKG